MTPSRRHLLAGLAAAPLLPRRGRAATREIMWEDLIPPGVPYSEIVGEGEMDAEADTWRPVFDANARRFSTHLDGETVRLPGYVLPLDTGGAGVREFILCPYVGACIHVPPPPPNQLVFVTTDDPWPAESLFEAVWVTGTLRVAPIDTTLAEIGYDMTAHEIETYIWPDEY